MKRITILSLSLFFSLSFSSCEILRSFMDAPTNQTVTCVPLTAPEYNNIYTLIASKKFDSDKRATAESSTAKAKCMTADQIKRIAELMTFENDRLEYLKFAYPYCSDPKNYGIMNSILTYESSKRELGAITGVN